MDFDHDELVRLFKLFDTDGQGYVDYDHFLRGIRGEMNQFRKNICMKAFKLMDVDGDGFITIQDVKHNCNAKKNPEVMQGKKTEDEVLYDFLETFDTHH